MFFFLPVGGGWPPTRPCFWWCVRLVLWTPARWSSGIYPTTSLHVWRLRILKLSVPLLSPSDVFFFFFVNFRTPVLLSYGRRLHFIYEAECCWMFAACCRLFFLFFLKKFWTATREPSFPSASRMTARSHWRSEVPRGSWRCAHSRSLPRPQPQRCFRVKLLLFSSSSLMGVSANPRRSGTPCPTPPLRTGTANSAARSGPPRNMSEEQQPLHHTAEFSERFRIHCTVCSIAATILETRIDPTLLMEEGLPVLALLEKRNNSSLGWGGYSNVFLSLCSIFSHILSVMTKACSVCYEENYYGWSDFFD